MCKFEKAHSRTFFTSLINNLSTEDLVTFGNLLSIEFLKTKRQFYATPSRQAWLPQDLRNNFFKPLMNRRMTGLALKP
jgi:hypothetical protein